jgi:hypothetical protein
MNVPVKLTHDIPLTVLPDYVVLTNSEISELCKLEKVYVESTLPHHPQYREFRFKTNPNFGIHHFCLEKNFGLDLLSFNGSISLSMVNLIFEKLKTVEEGHYNACLYDGLLYNPKVFSNSSLFTMIFNQAFSSESSRLLFALVRVMMYIPFDVFMLLLLKIGEFRDDDLDELYSKEAFLHKEEILDWVQINNPQLVGLPLPWVLKTFGLRKIYTEEKNDY